jgi:hypothetical protein
MPLTATHCLCEIPENYFHRHLTWTAAVAWVSRVLAILSMSLIRKKHLVIPLLILNLGTAVTWWLGSHFGHFLQKKNTTGIYWIGSWMCPRFVLVAMEKRNSSPCRESNNGFPELVACSVYETNLVVDIYRINHIRHVIADPLLIFSVEQQISKPMDTNYTRVLLILT